VGASFLVFPAQAVASNAPETFVKTRIEAGQAILKNPLLSGEQRRQEFRAFVLSITDMKRAALFTVGPYARSALESDISPFVAAFTEFTIMFYERILESHAERTIRVTGSTQRSDDDAVVTADVVDASSKSPPLKIGFRVRKNERGDPILTDLQFEGAWLLINQRSEFVSFLQQNRGDLSRLSQELEKRAQVNRKLTS